MLPQLGNKKKFNQVLFYYLLDVPNNDITLSNLKKNEVYDNIPTPQPIKFKTNIIRIHSERNIGINPHLHLETQIDICAGAQVQRKESAFHARS